MPGLFCFRLCRLFLRPGSGYAIGDSEWISFRSALADPAKIDIDSNIHSASGASVALTAVSLSSGLMLCRYVFRRRSLVGWSLGGSAFALCAFPARSALAASASGGTGRSLCKLCERARAEHQANAANQYQDSVCFGCFHFHLAREVNGKRNVCPFDSAI